MNISKSFRRNIMPKAMVVSSTLVFSALFALASNSAYAFDTDGCSAANVSEFDEYSLIYALNIPDDDDTAGSKPAYATDNSGVSVSFNRVAYCLELEINGVLEWTWVSMDAVTTTIREIGVPVSSADAFQQTVNNMNVFASAGSGVTTGNGIATGNIEFFNNNYSQTAGLGGIGGSDAAYDFDDTRGTAQARGSMQVHNYGAGETIFAYNGWDTNNGQPDAVGIGTNPGLNPDWTNEANSDSYNCGANCRKDLYVLVRKLDIFAFAGNGEPGFGGNGGQATAAMIDNPAGLAIDASGNIYIADSANNRIRRVAANGVISTFAGTGNAGFADGAADQAQFSDPTGLDFDGAGNLYVADRANKRVRMISAAGTVSTFAGNGASTTVDNVQATQSGLRNPVSVSVSDAGVVYIADQGGLALGQGPRIRKVELNGIITTIAGNGAPGLPADPATASTSNLDTPFAVYVDANDNVYISDSGNHAVRIIPAGTDTMSVFAGNSNGSPGVVPSSGEPARDAGLRSPRGISGDAAGNIYIADYNNEKVHKVDVDGRIVTIAGDGGDGFNGDGRDPLRASLEGPRAVIVDAIGDVVFADFDADRVRRVGLASINRPVTDIFLSNLSISTADGAGALVGMLSSEDESSGNTHRYSLVSGAGDTDNGSFQINGIGANAELQVGTGGALAAGNYAVRIQSDDQQDSTFHQTFVINAVSSNAVPPVITLVGANPQTITVGNAYAELGATATDDIDGDVSGLIVIDASAVDTATVGNYQVTYNVMDSSGNPATEAVRAVNVAAPDNTPPVITLTGSNPQSIFTGGAYAEQGATATDDVDGDISGNIVIDSSAVNTAAVGNYTVTYNVMDAAGNTATEVTRTVSVQNRPVTPPPTPTSSGGGSFGAFGLLFLFGLAVRRRIFAS